jgi:hypothetical protein
MRGRALQGFLNAIACSSLLLGAQTIGAQPESPAVIAKHQLSECMSKRMSADRNLSYNDAMRSCKERLQPPKDLAAINPIETATKGH